MNENMRVLFLVVQSQASYRLFEEIGVGYLAAYLRKHGHEVMLMTEDAATVDYERIQSFKPDLIGMPVYIPTEEAVYKVSSELKKRIPSVYIAVGGYSPTYRGAEMLAESSDIDFVLCGEGELATLNLITALLNNQSLGDIKGLIYRNGDNIIVNEDQELIPDIDILPWPARDLLVEKKYKVALISTSRGCTGNCSFCVTRPFWKKWRGRNVKDVVDEMEYIVNNYGINVFHFIDCSFENPGMCYERVKEIAQEILDRKLKVFYFAFIRPDFHRKADHELMELVRDSGMMGALIGVESNDAETLKVYNKHTLPEDNAKVVELFRKYNIYVDIGFIMFNPYSTFEGLRQNIYYLESFGFACILGYVAGLYIMFEGCALFEKIKRDGILEDEENILGYRYVDERVEKVSKYVSRFVQQVETSTNATFLRIHKSLITLAYWKRIYADNQKLYEVLVEMEQHYAIIRDELNSRIANWFRKLLDLGENNWDEAEADVITNEIMSRDYIIGVSKNMEHKRNILHIKLSRHGFDIKAAPFIETI